MLVRWQFLVDYYGADITGHRGHLSKAHNATYTVLLNKWSPIERFRFTNQAGEHAEERLVRSAAWTEGVTGSLAARDDRDTAPLVITLALNRSPCGHCAGVLADGLSKLQFSYARRFENAVFILASLGYYQSGKFMSDAHEQRHPSSGERLWVTTDKGLERLEETGWRLAALSFDDEPTQRGQELMDYLRRA